MRRIIGVAAGVAATLTSAFASSGFWAFVEVQTPPTAQGVVYHDANQNGKRDVGERGIGGVLVSDQTQVVRTDREGRWSMPTEADEDTIYFVVKPEGWMTPVNTFMIPQFYYIHKPKGSPKTRFPGVDPTGPLPKSIDFPLVPAREPGRFESLMFGDTQPRDLREVDYIRRDVIEPLIGQTNAKFGVTLGDIVFDDLTVFEPLARVTAMLGMPWYHVIGNHDINFDVRTDELSDEAWERFFGPNYYAFQHGPVHFLSLDNIHWEWPEGQQRGRYLVRFGDKQIAWIERYLSMIPRQALVVLMMHAPFQNTEDREKVYRLLEQRPHSLSLSAHTHFHENVFIDESMGWKGKGHHHHVNLVTVSGSWWQGAPDEFGIPHSTMRDGAPNGYTLFSFNGTQYSYQFRAARRHENFQMLIHAPDEIDHGKIKGTEVLANVFAGSSRSVVEMRLGESGEWVRMQQVRREDPAYRAMFERDQALQRPFRALPAPIQTPHMWRGELPATRLRGMVNLYVRTVDMFGQRYQDAHGIFIR